MATQFLSKARNLVIGVGNKMEDSEIEGEDTSLVKWDGQKGSDCEVGEKWKGFRYMEEEE